MPNRISTSGMGRALLAVAVLLVSSGPVWAVVTGVSSVTVANGTDPDDKVLTGAMLETGSHYSTFTAPTSATVLGGSARFWATGGTDPGTNAASLTSLVLTDGVANVDIGTELQFMFGQSISLGDTIVLFEIRGGIASTNDQTDITLKPVDSSGAVIGDYVLVLDGNDGGVDSWGSVVHTDNLVNIGDASFFGVSFNLGDFTGTTGDLSLTTGFEFSSVGGTGTARIDPALMAIASPEPATITLLALGAMAVMRRRPHAR